MKTAINGHNHMQIKQTTFTYFFRLKKSINIKTKHTKPIKDTGLTRNAFNVDKNKFIIAPNIFKGVVALKILP